MQLKQCKPKAYLNMIVLDEQLHPVLTGDGKNSYFQQVSIAGGSSVNQIVLANREISKSGYVYIYVSNESKDFKVYFDNLKVTHVRGHIKFEVIFSTATPLFKNLS